MPLCKKSSISVHANLNNLRWTRPRSVLCLTLIFRLRLRKCFPISNKGSKRLIKSLRISKTSKIMCFSQSKKWAILRRQLNRFNRISERRWRKSVACFLKTSKRSRLTCKWLLPSIRSKLRKGKSSSSFLRIAFRPTLSRRTSKRSKRSRNKLLLNWTNVRKRTQARCKSNSKSWSKGANK